jgi:periplasmic mercuric ion binding protein
MKTIKILLASVFALALAFNATAQTNDKSKANSSQTATKTETFKVWGECGMCKTRIEKTVKAEGASNALWDEKSKMLSVTYDPAKTNKDALSKKLASVGHDTEKFKAPDDVYAKLPDCCHYERQK